MRPIVLSFLLIFQSVGCAVPSSPKPGALPDGWVEVSEVGFRLSIPATLLKEDVTGIDTFYQRYSDANMSLTIEAETGFAELDRRLTGKDVTDVKRMVVESIGEKSLLASYTFVSDRTNFQDPDKHFAMELAFNCRLQSRNMSFLVLYSTPEQASVAEKLLRSVIVDCG
ncbi:MAG: hypothetical protein JSS77_01465 [Acidobacteria bacterium]|nr:hypothetical protein [Acidobacteriota bacterium]